MRNLDEIIYDIRRLVEVTYEQGYLDGLKNTVKEFKCEMSNAKCYQRGLKDAWEFMTKIVDDNFEMDELKTVFGTCNIYYILKRNTASEAMQKIKDYEERQNVKKVYEEKFMPIGKANMEKRREERQTEEIKVGDEVKVYDDCIGIVTRHAPQARTCYVMYRDGSCGEEELTDCKKTGNHSMSLDKWLEQMRKESE